MKVLTRFLMAMLSLLLLFLSAPSVFADRGMVPISDVSVYGPGQKAIIAWNGEQEILILSTDVYASGDSMVLEILPLPSEPQRIEEGDFSSFIQIQQLIEEHLPSSWWDRFMPGLEGKGEGVEVIFHQRIGAHDITVVRASDTEELVQWAQGFLEDRGIEHDISSPKLESVVGRYIEDGIEFFVFDLIEVTSDPGSIEPIIYQFETDSLYYPLVISSLASGETEISLFLLTPGIIDFAELPRGMHLGLHYGQPVRFQLDEGELRAIDSEIAQLLGDGAWLTAVKYDGDLEDLESDLRIYSGGGSAELAFLSLGGSCTAVEESEATISLRGDRVFFSGSVIAPTPCHELRAELEIPPAEIYPQMIIVNISAEELPGTICIQCIGEIPFKGEIRNLDPGEYDVLMLYQGRTIAQQRVEIPQVQPMELPIGATLEVDPSEEISVRVDGTPVVATAIEVKIIDLPGEPPLYKDLRIEVDEIFEEISIRVNGVSATIKETIKIEDSQLFLETPQGPLLVRVMPDEVLQVLLEQEIQYFELKAVEGRPVFAVEGIVKAKLFGLIPIDMRIESTVDAESGEILDEEMPWWAVFCSLPGHGD
ncbi:MAG: DUF2330 domain-containing protein [Dehalococcoidia bacterium]|nr:MAG: DUF2330 domain-containing protein [Dehalococcoidia bacterium]